MPILAAFMVPHPPMIVPDVGRGSEKQVEATTRAYQQVAEEIAALAPETIVITSPHSIMYRDYFHISPGDGAAGSFRDFGAPGVRFKEEYDAEFRQVLCDLADDRGFPAGTLGQQDPALDHGTMVPLYFIRQRLPQGKILRIGLSGLPLTDHYILGQMIRQVADELGRRTVFVASGDLSHKLQEYGPYGYVPEGPEYDRKIMDTCGRGAFGELFSFGEEFCNRAAECGHRSFVIMAGALDGVPVRPKVLSHEDVTGVGYGICTFYPEGVDGSNAVTGTATDDSRKFLDAYRKQLEEDAASRRKTSDEYVELAWRSLESYLLNGKPLSVPEVVGNTGVERTAGEPEDKASGALALPEEMLNRQAGVFVSIHKEGNLRGCIGTIQANEYCIAEEIIQNAISAATRDPRFDPIQPEELKLLEISVDVLGDAEPIQSEDQLDVKRYGVIVTSGYKRGLLLPDLDGVDTPQQQVDIARRKAGIRPGESVKLQRFEVIRHH